MKIEKMLLIKPVSHFWEILIFWTNLGNFENQQKTLGK